MFTIATFYSILYTLIIGCIFMFMFIFTYDFLYGEKQEKQIKKLYKYFRNETIKDIHMTEHLPKNYTRYNVVTTNGIKKVKVKPGYKVVKIVPQKDSSSKSARPKQKQKK